MKCPKCQFENREGVKFCEECGAEMEWKCPKCGAGVPPGRKFCGECGHSLNVPSEQISKELTFGEKLAAIQRSLSKDLTQKTLAQRDKIEGEIKQVTVMFCDMEGYTSLTEKLGPEQMYSLMDDIYEILIHKVHDYEGTVNELTGDGIMALFGAPIALEDAPQRAIRSALAVHREMNKYSEKLKSERRIPPIRMRIGIHTGPVVVGTLGNDLRVEFKAVGDTVNVASRTEGLAVPGTTCVTENTFKLTEGFFRFEALGEKKVKGKEEPIQFYQVIAPSTRSTKFDVSAERGLTPFIGRDRELELLLDGFRRAKSGKGQVFSIISEAGVGKSRLLYEFRKAVANEDVIFLEGKCLSYSRGVAYHPVIDILKANFDIQEGEGDQEIKEKVKKRLEFMGLDEASTRSCILELLSVKGSGVDQLSMSPEAKKDRTIEAIKRIVLKGSEMRCPVIAIEDLHWMDKSSEAVARDLLESIPESRVLLIFTYRPDFVYTWGDMSHHRQLALHRLSDRESLEMVTSILGTREIERTLEELILEKSEGVPFFIEEFIKSFKDLNIIERKEDAYQLTKDLQLPTIPSTIQDIIMARVDSLPERAKEVLQKGSVIEREFSYPLIHRVTAFTEEELLSYLSILKDSELLYERGVYPHSNYIFRHAMTREVVYDSILAKRKKNIHQEIGKAIEELYKDNLSEHYEVLAEHYFLGENYQKSAEYSKLASRKAGKGGSIIDAIAFARKRIASVEQLPQIENVERQIIDARTVLGLYLAQMMYHIEAKEAIDPIIDLAIKRNYKRRLCQIYSILGFYYWSIEENYPESFRAFEEALRISGEENDIITLVLANVWSGNAFSFSCEFEKSKISFQQALDINVAANNLWGISIIKGTLALFSYYFPGKLHAGIKISSEAVDIAEESGDIYSKAHAYTSHGVLCHGKGFMEMAEGHLLKGAECCEKMDYRTWDWCARFCLGQVYFELGDFQKAEENFEKASSAIDAIHWAPSLSNLAKVGVAKSRLLSQGKDVNLELMHAFSRNNKVKILEGWFQRFIAEILLGIDDRHFSEAEHSIQKAIESDRRNRMMFHLGLGYSLYADLFKRKGDGFKARENLGKAIEILKECGADGWVERYEKELAALS